MDKLAGLGISTRPDRILTPAVAAVARLRHQGIDRPALFVADATAAELAELHPVPDGVEQGAGAVVIGDLGDGWRFSTLNRAFRLLMSDAAVPLIAGDDPVLADRGRLRHDAGAFVRALEYAAGRTAVDALGLEPQQVVMVGDEIHADVAGAAARGSRHRFTVPPRATWPSEVPSRLRCRL